MIWSNTNLEIISFIICNFNEKEYQQILYYNIYVNHWLKLSTMNDIFSHLPIFWYINILKIFVVGMGMLKNVMILERLVHIIGDTFFFWRKGFIIGDT